MPNEVFETLVLRNESSQLEVSLYGAHILSWICEEEERLYLSPTAEFAQGKAIRGGIPVIFPQFSNIGKLTKHGFARTEMWSVQSQEENALTLQLKSNKNTLMVWPFEFEILLKIKLLAKGLQLDFVVNNLDAKTMEFTTALHSYLRVSDIRQIEISDLLGFDYDDQVKQEKNKGTQSHIKIIEEFDRIYFNVHQAIELKDGLNRLTFESEGYSDLVIWNPDGLKAADLKDLPNDDFKSFVCLEPARIKKPVELSTGQVWQSQHIIRIQ
jgi:glucose-6-phosphate 1-epimerase